MLILFAPFRSHNLYTFCYIKRQDRNCPIPNKINILCRTILQIAINISKYVCFINRSLVHKKENKQDMRINKYNLSIYVGFNHDLETLYTWGIGLCVGICFQCSGKRYIDYVFMTIIVNAQCYGIQNITLQSLCRAHLKHVSLKSYI